MGWWDFNNLVASGWFMQFPAGTVDYAAGARMTVDPSTGLLRSDQLPALFGAAPSTGWPPTPSTSPPSYDLAHDRWLPAPRAAVSPDGNRYAYADYPHDAGVDPTVTWIHVVDVATAKDQVVAKFATYHAIVYFSAAGIYMLRGPYRRANLYIGTADIAVPDGLVLMDPTTGGSRTIIAGSRRWSFFSPTSAWAAEFQSPDNSPAPLLGGVQTANRIIRLDLATGTASVWSNHLGTFVELIGIGAGDQPVVLLGEPSGIFMDIGSASIPIFTSTRSWIVFDSVLADNHGTWLANNDLSLYNAGSPLRQVTHRNGAGWIVGACS